MTAVIVTDLGFGDSGKGTVTDFLVRELGAGWVVRHNGGAQAGHNVVTDDGRHHTFSQFGAGSFVAGVKTYLSKYMLVHPGGLLEEARVLIGKGVSDAHSRLHIDPQARLITPYHQAANRLREVLRGDQRHGSCGLGVGETMHHSLEAPDEVVVAEDLFHRERLSRKLIRIQKRYWQEFSPYRKELFEDRHGRPEIEILESCDASLEFMEQACKLSTRVGRLNLGGETVVFEGAQGVLLDEWRGFHPYTTWSTCTFHNALALAEEWGLKAFRMGVVRSYATRHGAGPFPTEDLDLRLPEPHNCWGPWQQDFRLGWLDLCLLRYAVKSCGGVDGLAVTHLDRVDSKWKICERYADPGRLELGPFQDLNFQQEMGERLGRMKPCLERVSGAEALLERLGELGPLVLESWGPTASKKRTPKRSAMHFGEYYSQWEKQRRRNVSLSVS